jgi:hypothetical protein
MPQQLLIIGSCGGIGGEMPPQWRQNPVRPVFSGMRRLPEEVRAARTAAQDRRVDPNHLASGCEVANEMMSPGPLPSPVFPKNDKVRMHLLVLQINAASHFPSLCIDRASYHQRRKTPVFRRLRQGCGKNVKSFDSRIANQKRNITSGLNKPTHLGNLPYRAWQPCWNRFRGGVFLPRWLF